MNRIFKAAFGGVLLVSGMQAFAQDAKSVVATVGGTEITLGHMILMRSQLPQQYETIPADQLYTGILDQLIQQEILAQSSAGSEDLSLQLGLDNESRAFRAGRVLDKLVSDTVTEEGLMQLYKDTIESAPSPMEWNANHILVETEEKAIAIVDDLTLGVDFEEMAKQMSTGPSGPNGGALGWFGAGAMVPPFEAGVADLQVGEVSAPVKTRFGWHVIKLNETREQPKPSFEESRADLHAQLEEIAISAGLAALEETATVSRAELDVDPLIITNMELLDQ